MQTSKLLRGLLACASLAIVLAFPVPAFAACTNTQVDLDGNGTTDFQIVGDSRIQTLTITDSGGSAVVSLDCNNDGDNLDAGELDAVAYATNFETFDLRLGGGADVVTFSLGASYSGHKKNLLVQMGAGGTALVPQSFTFDTATFDITAKSSLTIALFGGNGADEVTFDFDADIDDSAVFVAVTTLGSADTIDVDVDDIDSAANAASFGLVVDPGLGANTMTVELGDIESAASARADVMGGSSIDDLTVTLNGVVAGRVAVDASLQSGADVCAVVFSGAFDMSAGSRVDIALDGGSGNDDLSIDSTTTVELEGTLAIRVEGGLGAESASPITVDLLDLDIDGTLQVYVDGGAGDDDIAVVLEEADAAGPTGVYDVSVYGGLGNDDIDLDFTEGAAALVAANFAPAPFVLLDGGLGTNTKDITGVVLTNEATLIHEVNF